MACHVIRCDILKSDNINIIERDINEYCYCYLCHCYNTVVHNLS